MSLLPHRVARPATSAAAPSDRQRGLGSADYNAVYLAHRARVLALCRLMLDDSAEAEEATQEVLLKALRWLRSQGPPENWAKWLASVAINVCRDRRRSAWWKWWKTRRAELADADQVQRSASAETEVSRRELCRRLQIEFRRLPARQREIFTLRLLEQWTSVETAAALGISPGSVKRQLFRAVHRLRKAIGQKP